MPHLYEAQHVSGDTPPIIRSLKLHWQPLVFIRGRLFGRVVGGRCQALCLTTRGCQCSFRLLMMGGVSPETCWPSYKYGIIKFWYTVASCWIFLYEVYSYYDARIHKHLEKEARPLECIRCQLGTNAYRFNMCLTDSVTPSASLCVVARMGILLLQGMEPWI
jgi:hypothetical protein